MPTIRAANRDNPAPTICTTLTLAARSPGVASNGCVNPKQTDLGSQYKSIEQSQKIYRPVAATTYLPGAVLQSVSQDLELFPDQKCAQLSSTAAAQQGLVGVVDEDWPGFAGSIGPASYVSPPSFTNFRGTVGVNVKTMGYHSGVLVDQSGTGAVTLVNRLPLVASRATAGYAQGVAATAPLGGTSVVANAKLPASGIGSSITAAALAQASLFSTVATPAAGDVLTVTIHSPYVSSAPGVAQTTTWSTLPLTTAQAVSATTAGATLVAYLNSQPNFSQYFTATQVAGAVTVTVNTASAPFKVNFGYGSTETSSFSIGISGMIANSWTFAAGVVGAGGTTNTANGANLASGTGYFGTVPALIVVGGGG